MKAIGLSILLLCSSCLVSGQISIWHGTFDMPSNSNLRSVGNPSQGRTDTVNLRFASRITCALAPAVDVHFNELDMASPDNDIRISLEPGPATDDDVNIYIATWWTNTVNSYNGEYTAWCPASGTGKAARTEDEIKAHIAALAKATAEKKAKEKGRR